MSTAAKHTRRSSPAHVNGSHITEMREQLDTMGQAIRGMAESAGAVAVDQLDPVQEYVRAKPIKSLLIAAGCGAVLSFIFLRR